MDKPTLRDRVRSLIIANRVAQKSVEPLPPLRNRGEARKFLQGRGPFQRFVMPTPPSQRRVTTRQKRAEQRERANGRAASE